MSVPSCARIVVPGGTQVHWPERQEDAARVAVLPPGSLVALADRRPGARRRLRHAAYRLGVRVEVEYVVLPTWSRATFVAADDVSTVTWVLSTFSTTPPYVTRGAYLLDAAQRVWQRVAATRAGAVTTHRLVCALAPGRLLIGTRR
jgi:hypothetical protein